MPARTKLDRANRSISPPSAASSLANLTPSRLRRTHRPARDRIQRRAIDFIVMLVHDPDKAIPRTKLRLEHTKLARQRIRSIGCDGKVFQDHAALIVRLTVNQK